MPTRDDIKELHTYCTYEWTTLNGMNGMKFTSKSNSGSIFLPAAGFRWGGSLLNAGSYGLYWFSSQYPSSSSIAFSLYFASDSGYWYYQDRSRGQSVRSVVRN